MWPIELKPAAKDHSELMRASDGRDEEPRPTTSGIAGLHGVEGLGEVPDREVRMLVALSGVAIVAARN
jgi:hypothetical protein